MYPGTFAQTAPARPAVIMGFSGEVVTYRELDERSTRFAHALDALGLRRGDAVALLMENTARYHEIAWAVRRSGLYVVVLNHHLNTAELAYIVNDSGARVLVAASSLATTAGGLDAEHTPGLEQRLAVGGGIPGFSSFEELVATMPTTPHADEEGQVLPYSSGTTGRPKGIRRELPEGEAFSDGNDHTVNFLRALGFGESDVYLSPAPLYHAAPIYWSMAVHRMGGTVVVMERFEPERMLELIERHQVTHAQLVPTMFIRALRLSAKARSRYNLSSLQRVVHAAAPCPVPIKKQMIEWWGPIIDEFYSSSEGTGGTYITSPEWLEHPGSVGRAMLGTLHILDEHGNQLPPGQTGEIWAEGAEPFRYLNDEKKTASQTDARGWTTVGDIGYLDKDGYLYLTDRKAYMIISGGVNIYPQEAENVLAAHPRVMDVAVFGVPNAEYGEEVKAVVQPVDWHDVGPAFERELLEFCRGQLAAYKCPRSVDFDAELPRQENGKLYKRSLRERYWATTSS
ncbi:acyl-CoA synthetase [Gordonia polyisoprenivorans]|uniref:acyl-CoA synthetase n=1 Tax=Gordonia polyisoprenivorans TaxID=84595 RepID=UPI001AD6C11B|nr:acyl-CoA synthetase [Gordonia polyisoprenivorans]QTI70923.1 acyl-CoA synthetase [Gordonia polyisoprenivorans]